MSKRESMTEKLRRMNAERQETESSISEKHTSGSRTFDDRMSESGLAENRRGRAGEAHPGQGGRGDFLKVTVTMDPDDFEAINAEMVRRKRGKERGAQLSGCIREAIRFWRAAGMPRQE